MPLNPKFGNCHLIRKLFTLKWRNIRLGILVSLLLLSTQGMQGQFYFYLTPEECTNAYLVGRTAYTADLPLMPTVVLSEGQDSVFWDAFLLKSGIPPEWAVNRHPDSLVLASILPSLRGRSGIVGIRGNQVLAYPLDQITARRLREVSFFAAEFSPTVQSSTLLPPSFPLSEGMVFHLDEEKGTILAKDYTLDRVARFQFPNQGQTLETHEYLASDHLLEDYLTQFPLSEKERENLQNHYAILEKWGKDQISLRSVGQGGKQPLYMIEINLPIVENGKNEQSNISIIPFFYTGNWDGKSFQNCTKIGNPKPSHLDIDQHFPLQSVDEKTLLVPGFSLKGNDNAVLMLYSKTEGIPAWEYQKTIPIPWPNARWKQWRNYYLGDYLAPAGEGLAYQHLPLVYLPAQALWIEIPVTFDPDRLFETVENGKVKANFEVKAFRNWDGILEFIIELEGNQYWGVLNAEAPKEWIRWEMLAPRLDGQFCIYSMGEVFQITKDRKVNRVRLLGKE